MATRSPPLERTVTMLMKRTKPLFLASSVRLLVDSRCGTTDVEGTHGELRARLADGLRGDDADRFAELDQCGRRPRLRP